MARLYEVLFYTGWQDLPAYYLVDDVEGRTPREALRKNFRRVAERVRSLFALGPDMEDYDICDSLYVLKADGLVSARDFAE